MRRNRSNDCTSCLAEGQTFPRTLCLVSIRDLTLFVYEAQGGSKDESMKTFRSLHLSCQPGAWLEGGLEAQASAHFTCP